MVNLMQKREIMVSIYCTTYNHEKYVIEFD